MARTLLQMPIEDSMDAPAMFGAPQNGGLLVARPGTSLAPWISVPEGFYALVTTNGAREVYEDSTTGTKSPVFPAGMHAMGMYAGLGLTKISHLITKQVVIFDAPVKGCKTSDNVTVQIDVSVAFRIMGEAKKNEDPSLVGKFVDQVTPNGLESQLKDALAEEIRTLARSMKHTEVYACRTGAVHSPPKASTGAPQNPLAGRDDDDDDDEENNETIARHGVDVTQQMQDRLNAQFKVQGVEISDVMIQDVVLPDEIVTQMSNRSLVRSKQEYEMMEQKFEMQGIALNNERKARTVQHNEAQEKAEMEGSRDTQLQLDKFKERQAVLQREYKDYDESTRQEIGKIRAETIELTTSLGFDKQRLLQTLELEGQEEASRVTAESTAKVRETVAQCALEVAKHNAKADMVVAEAEEKADDMLTTDRDLEIVDMRLKVYEKLVTNDQVVLSGTSNDSLNTLFLSDSILKGSSKDSHGGVLAQMNALRLASAAYGLQQGTYIPDGKSPYN